MVSVVICSYNRRALLRDCLTSLFNQTFPKDDYEIIVVDDGSTDGTDALLQEIAAKPGPPLRHFRQDNKGSATARNLCIRNAQGQIIASIDDDCVATASWMENAVPHFANDTTVGVQGQTLPAEPVRLRFFPPRFSYTLEVTDSVWTHPTCNMFYRKQAILEVGGFNEEFSMPGPEDVDLALRLQEIGNIVFCRDALVYHAVFYDTLAQRLRFMRRYQYEPILFKQHPHLRKDLLLGFVYSKEVVHVPFFFLAALAGLLSAVVVASPLAAAILAVMWTVVYLWSNVLVDHDVRQFPLRIALFPVKLLLHSTKLYYHLLGSIRYRSLII
jgi:glycosyltransferase involved in cell wall biosynthesis